MFLENKREEDRKRGDLYLKGASDLLNIGLYGVRDVV